MAAELFYVPYPMAFTSNGLGVPGAQIYFFTTGTNTPAPAYTTADMTTEHPHPIEANGAGRIPPIYLDGDIDYRLRITDPDGAQLGDDIDPYTPGTIIGGTIGPSGTAVLSGLAIKTPQQFGAVANGTTDDSAAFVAMFASLPSNGGFVHIPAGYYRIASRITVPKNVYILGASAGTRSFVYGEAIPSNAWESYSGAVLVSSTNTAGLLFPLHTDVDDTDTVIANKGATASNPTYWEFPGSQRSKVQNLVLYSLGGTSTSAHGIEARSEVEFDNVIVVGYGGHGFFISASVDQTSAGSSYGNASGSEITHCRALLNRGCGFRHIGRDANAISYSTCHAQLNGSWGFDAEALYGAVYTACHAATNNTLSASYPTYGAAADASVGSFRNTQASSANNYIGCYVETGNGGYASLQAGDTVDGGILAGVGQVNAGVPLVKRGGVLTQSGFRHYNSRGTYDIGVSFGSGDADNRVFAFGSEDERPDISTGGMSLELKYDETYRYWPLIKPGVTTREPIGFATSMTNVQRISPFLGNGFFLGSPLQGLRNHVRASDTFTIASPDNGVYAKRDIIIKGPGHADAVAGGKMGFICTAAGVKETTAWGAGANLTPVLGNQSLGVYRINGGNVYKLTTKNGGATTTANAPVHGSGEVIGADGYGWTFMNATTVPTFKEWGAIDA